MLYPWRWHQRQDLVQVFVAGPVLNTCPFFTNVNDWWIWMYLCI